MEKIEKAHSYKAQNFNTRRENYKLELKQVAHIEDVSRFLGVNLAKAADKIMMANVINLISVIARNDTDNYYMRTHTQRPSLEKLKSRLEKHFAMPEQKADKLLILCIHTSKRQKSGFFSYCLRTGSAHKIYTILKRSLDKLRVAAIIGHKLMYRFFTQQAVSSIDSKRIDIFLQQFFIDEFNPVMHESVIQEKSISKEPQQISVVASSAMSSPKSVRILNYDAEPLFMTEEDITLLVKKKAQVIISRGFRQYSSDKAARQQFLREMIFAKLVGMIKAGEIRQASELGANPLYNKLLAAHKLEIDQILLNEQRRKAQLVISMGFKQYQADKVNKRYFLSEALFLRLKEAVWVGDFAEQWQLEASDLYQKLRPQRRVDIHKIFERYLYLDYVKHAYALN